MTPRDLDDRPLPEQLSLLGAAFLLTDVGATDHCLSESRVRELAVQPREHLDATLQHHLDHCARCAHKYVAFRSVHLARALAPNWCVALPAPEVVPSLDDGAYQLFGSVSLDTGVVTWVEEEDWIRSSLHIRITLLIDASADTVGLTVADVPSTVQGVVLRAPHHSTNLERIEDLELYQTSAPLTALVGENDPQLAAARFLKWMHERDLMLELTIGLPYGTGKSAVGSVLEPLLEVAAIERHFDYELPSGLHSDTHVNVGALCRSEIHLSRVAAAFDAVFADVTFDTVVTNGWAMATIARRLAGLRAVRSGRETIADIICEGYQRVLLAGDILPHSAVLVLVDVNVTGTLVERLRNETERAGASVVGIGALVHALSPVSRRPDGLRSLCTLAMDIADPIATSCPRCGVREARVFNPVSYCMTQRAPYPRSPSEFLADNPEAREFWRFVDIAHAYEHHRREDTTHYIAFIDTRKLLEHAEVGPILIERLRDRILGDDDVPSVILIPNRPRARILGSMLAKSIAERFPRPDIIVARRPRRSSGRTGPTPAWTVPPSEIANLAHRRTLVVDAAAGHGNTIDRLTQLARSCNASTTGAAVLISRLTEHCEQAFVARLPGGFHWLYHLPIRPVVIRGEDVNSCPICQRRAAIEQATAASGDDALEHWSQQLLRRGRRSTPTHGEAAAREVQLQLFPVAEDFLEKCRESVASGVTLHALNAAMTNGMAPLRLPELFNNRIPSRTRAAMVENLPQGAVEWSGEILADDLRDFLSRGTAPNVWRASAEVLVKDGADEWLQRVDEFLERLHKAKTPISPTFWNHLACTTYLAVKQNPSLRAVVRERLHRLAQSVRATPDEKGVRRILDTLPG